jgi:GAF domain-containing protein
MTTRRRQEPPGAQIQRLLQALDASGEALLPQSSDQLLASIVEAAARIFGAAAASILLIDEKEKMLVFRVAWGAADHNLVGMRFPLDQGIAGYVALTGQPIAISDVQQDARFNQSFARQTGYVPKSILAMPLLLGERVIGVMEVLDKISAPSFGMRDMELLALFAHQAALAIGQSQQAERMSDALLFGLREAAGQDAALAATLDETLAALRQGSTAQAQDILALARLFNDISSLGHNERAMCLQILAAFGDYARARAKLAATPLGFGRPGGGYA